MLKKLLPTVFILYFVIASTAQTKMSLQDAIDYAMEHNLAIKKSLLDIADADAQVEERRSSGLPQITGEVGYNRYLQTPVQVLPEAFATLIELSAPPGTDPETSSQVSFIPKHNISAGINLQTMIFDGSFFTALKAAKIYKNYAAEELEATKQNIRNSVIDAYLPALIIKENETILTKNIKNVTELRYGVNETYKEGFIEQLEVDRLDLTLANLATTKNNLVRQEEIVVNYLKLAIGFPVSEKLIVTDDITTLLVEATEEELTGVYNYLDRRNVRVAEMGLQLSELNMEYNKNLYWPSLGFIAGYNYAFQGDKLFGDPNSFWAPTAVVGLSLRVPILDGLGKNAKLERQRLAYEIAQNQKDQLTHLIDIEIDNARKQYQAATERLTNQKKNLALAEKIYNTTKIKYKEGVGTSLELNQAERDLFETQQNYTQALYEVLVAKMELRKALGK